MRILVVDDEKLNQLVLKRLLEDAGYEYYGCSSGTAALEHLAHHECDVVLMDNRMPGISGTETARRIRALTGIVQPTILSFSAYLDPAERDEAVAAGMDGVIEKPLSLEAFRQTLRDLQDS